MKKFLRVAYLSLALLLCSNIAFSPSMSWSDSSWINPILPNGIFFKGTLANGTVQNLIGTNGSDTQVSWLSGQSLNLTSSSGSVSWQINNANLYGNGSTNFIGALTNDGSDANATCISGGGSSAPTRGGFVCAYGNENVSQTGSVNIEAGNISGAVIQFRNAASQSWTIDADGDINQNSTGGNNIYLNKNGTGIFGPGGAADLIYFGQQGADGSDDSRTALVGGGTGAPGRGASIFAYGNDYGGASSGMAIVQTGDAANALLKLIMNVSTAIVSFRNSSDVEVARVNHSGQITSAATSDIGWAVVNAANQACNTTCTSACVVGIDTGSTTSAFLGCTDATADSCLCAGAS